MSTQRIISPAAAVVIIACLVLFGSNVALDAKELGKRHTVAGQAQLLSISPFSIDYPSWSKHGVQHDDTILVENLGTEPLTLEINLLEFSGPSGWLAADPLVDTIPTGIGNYTAIALTFNPGGFINDPGTVVHLGGALEFVHNFESSPDTFFIDHWVADTVVAPEYDTISTDLVSLAVNSAGNYGNQGTDSVSMDFSADPLECDSTATVYLYDASPVVGWIDGSDTVMNWSVYGDGWLLDNGLRPVAHQGPELKTGNSGDEYDWYRVEFMSNDSSVGMTRTWYAPREGADLFDARFILMKTDVYLRDGAPDQELLVGEFIDWDVPSDSNVTNGSEFDDTRRLIWQFGGEYNQDDSTECQNNDTRYGALGFVDGDHQGLSAYTADLATYVFPTSFLEPGQMYDRMYNSVAFEVFNSQDPDSVFVDLFTVMVYTKDFAMSAGDTLSFVTALITVRDGTDAVVQAAYDEADLWYDYNVLLCCFSTCYDRPGDINGDWNNADPADLACLVDHLFGSGCPEIYNFPGETDVNGDGFEANPVDLVYLVDYLFNDGPEPPPCP